MVHAGKGLTWNGIEGTEVTGSIYVSKDLEQVPKTITVTLSVKDAAKEEE